MKEYTKGTIILDDWWYVVVSQKDGWVHCICDNANNRYSFNEDDMNRMRYVATAYQAMKAHGWGGASDKFNKFIRERPIPVDIIAEVLAGCHDDRFKDK